MPLNLTTPPRHPANLRTTHASTSQSGSTSNVQRQSASTSSVPHTSSSTSNVPRSVPASASVQAQSANSISNLQHSATGQAVSSMTNQNLPTAGYSGYQQGVSQPSASMPPPTTQPRYDTAEVYDQNKNLCHTQHLQPGQNAPPYLPPELVAQTINLTTRDASGKTYTELVPARLTNVQQVPPAAWQTPGPAPPAAVPPESPTALMDATLTSLTQQVQATVQRLKKIKKEPKSPSNSPNDSEATETSDEI